MIIDFVMAFAYFIYFYYQLKKPENSLNALKNNKIQ